MNRRHGFTLIELLVVISIIALLIGILMPALGAARRAARQMQNGTQVRGIHQGLILHSQGNKGFYIGLDPSGATVAPDFRPGGTLGEVNTNYRVAALIRQGYFTRQYSASPSENIIDEAPSSYAMVGIGLVAGNINLDANIQRNQEWRETMNSEAVIISDRAVMHGASNARLKSIHTTPSATTDDWRGSVSWNDNHVTFESTNHLVTKYGNWSSTSTASGKDNLFADDANAGGNTNVGRNAFMTWRHNGNPTWVSATIMGKMTDGSLIDYMEGN